MNYKFGLPVEIIFKCGAVKNINKVIKDNNFKKGILISSERFIKSEYGYEIIQLLNEYIENIHFGISANPTIEDVELTTKAIKDSNVDFVIALGGGSILDCAKISSCMAAMDTNIRYFLENKLEINKNIPVIAIPTTAGTGSEATVAAVITDENEHHKFTINDPKLIPDVAVLDPCLTVNMPKHLTATTGMDALTHAVEAYTNIFSGPTDRGAKYAVRLIFRYLPQVYRDGDEIAAREKMLEASYEAGVAFTRSCVGYVHAIAHTLGGLYGTPHGLANAVILPHILELYGKAVYKPLAELADAADISGNSDREKAENFIGAIRQMNKDMDIPEHLEIKDEDIPKMIKWAIAEANPVYPVPVIWNEADFRKAIDKIRGKI